MKYSLLSFLFILFSCTSHSTRQVTYESNSLDSTSDKKIDTAQQGKTILSSKPVNSYRIIGTEPFWNITIQHDTCLFSFLSEKVDTVYFTIDSTQVTEQNVAFYLHDPNDISAELKLFQIGKCTDGMSDKSYAYSASFLYKRMTLNGCGERIHE